MSQLAYILTSLRKALPAQISGASKSIFRLQYNIDMTLTKCFDIDIDMISKQVSKNKNFTFFFNYSTLVSTFFIYLYCFDPRKAISRQFC